MSTKTYTSEDPQYIFQFVYSFGGTNYTDYVVAYDKQIAIRKFQHEYPHADVRMAIINQFAQKVIQ